MTDKKHAKAHVPPDSIPSEAPETEEQLYSAWKFIVAFVILLIIFIGFTYYTTHKRQATIEANRYNGFEFTPLEGGMWATRIQLGTQPFDLQFYYHPRDTLTVLIDPGVTEPFMNNTPDIVWISVDPNDESKVVIAGVEFARILGSKYNMYNLNVQSAISKPANAKADWPVVTCDNATRSEVVIQLLKGKQDLLTRYDQNQNCILVQYTTANESIRVADRFAYMLLGIMH